MNDTLKMFCVFLLLAYNDVSKANRTFYVRVHDVKKKLGISNDLLEKRLNEIWEAQFNDYNNFPYILTLEVDLSPVESWRLRKQKIYVRGLPANIMQFHSRF
jgi:hypothetical protein